MPVAFFISDAAEAAIRNGAASITKSEIVTQRGDQSDTIALYQAARDAFVMSQGAQAF